MPFKECQQLNLRLWECPSFLFVIMGLITITAILSTYFIASIYAGPEVVVIAVTLTTIISFIIGHFVVRSVARIAQANQMKSEFVSIASHQLRTPLTALKWATEKLSSPNAEIIKTSTQQMLKLVNDLLNTAHIGQGKLILQKEKFDVQDLIKKIIKESEALAKTKDIKILSNQNKLKIFADRAKIKIVLENLINNAVHYNKKYGKIIINIKNNIVSIQDNGVGIPKAQQKQVFEKFFRANNALRYKTQGTGLGLYIAKAIIEAHQGKIWFKSQENKGTIFFVKL